jgi:LPS-assembly protein
MSRLGLGLGADYRYADPSSSGVASVYGIGGSWNELMFSNQHQQNFKFGTLSLTDDYENNNYLSDPGQTTFNIRGNLNMPQGSRGTTQLNFSDAISQSSTFNSNNQTFGITDDRRETRDLHTNFNLNYSSSSSSFQSGTAQKNQDANLKLMADDDLKKATVGFEYLRDIPIGQSANFNSGSDITPEVSLTSDSQKILGNKLAQIWPFHTELSWGDYANGITQTGQIGRSAFDFSFQKPDSSRKRLTFNFNGEFKQGIYSDGTAQYVLNGGSDLKYSLGRDSAVDLRYSYLRPYGYSPLSIDQSGQTNLVSLDASAKPLPGLLTGVQTGYDITRLKSSDEPWQVVGVRTEYALKNYLALRALSSYDPFQGEWSNINIDMTYRPGATMLAIGSRYDGVHHTWTAVNIALSNLVIGKTRFSTNLAYNGYTQRFDTQQYNVVYDLHCAEAVFTLTDQNFGFRPGRQIEFFIRLKAIPFDGNFGLGTRGQGFTTSTGIGY